MKVKFEMERIAGDGGSRSGFAAGRPARVLIAAALMATAAVVQVPGDAATAAPTAEREIAIDVERIAAAGEDLVVDLVVENLIDPATEEILARGVPVTLILDVEVWRERAAWFDHLEASRHLAYKLQLDAWDEVYVVRDAEGRQEVFLDLAEARGALEERPALRIAPLATIAEGASYYLVVTAALKPLTVEDVEELEGWLSGEIKSGRARDVGLLGLPKALFGVVMDVTGLGDRNDVKRTPSFQRGEVTASD